MTTPVVLHRTFPASIGAVFDAWTDPEVMVRWFSPNPDHVLRYEGVVEPGRSWAVHMGSLATVRGTYRVVEPPTRLEFTWAWDHEPDLPPSLVRVQLEPGEGADGGAVTALTLIHGDLVDLVERAGHLDGWTRQLDRLSRVLAVAPAC